MNIALNGTNIDRFTGVIMGPKSHKMSLVVYESGHAECDYSVDFYGVVTK